MKPLQTLSVTSTVVFCFALLPPRWSTAQETPPDPPAQPADRVRGEQAANYEELARGAVHEALAQPFVANPQAGILVKQQPPEPIDEIPPAQVLHGRNVQWLPGYWGWDDVGDRFIWISGLWRDLPPGRQWIPGYWTRADGGFLWIAGFWGSADAQEVSYLPYPPEPQDLAPAYDAPGDDYFWVPGCWLWRDNDYAWRPGYWARAQAGWAWMPHQYVWTPRGAIFVPGYWDYPLANRGLLFAPVFFHDPVWTYPGYRYRPTSVVQLGALLVHLWLRPQYSHYYFGDFYGDRYADFGYFPWYTAFRGDFGYDPLLAYYRWPAARRNYDFVDRMDAWHSYFVRHENYRPPHTMERMREFLGGRRELNVDESVVRQVALIEPLDDFVRQPRNRDRIRELQGQQQSDFRDQSQQFRKFLQQRAEFESDRGERAVPPGEQRPGERPQQADVRGKLQLPQTHRVLRPDLDRLGQPGQRPDQGRRPDEGRQPFPRPGERSQQPPQSNRPPQPPQRPDAGQPPRRPEGRQPGERPQQPPQSNRPPQPPRRPEVEPPREKPQQPQRPESPRGERRGEQPKAQSPSKPQGAPGKSGESRPKSPPGQEKPKQGKDGKGKGKGN